MDYYKEQKKQKEKDIVKDKLFEVLDVIANKEMVVNSNDYTEHLKQIIEIFENNEELIKSLSEEQVKAIQSIKLPEVDLSKVEDTLKDIKDGVTAKQPVHIDTKGHELLKGVQKAIEDKAVTVVPKSQSQDPKQHKEVVGGLVDIVDAIEKIKISVAAGGGKGYANVGLLDESDNRVGVQAPLSTDGDTVYEKDIDATNSDIGDFTGTVASLVNDYTTEISDSTITNPKILKIRFHRPISSNALGIGSITGDFSNVKILLKDLAGTTRVTVDDSTNNTKYTSNVYAFQHAEFIEAEIQFHTADTVTLNGMFVPKQGHVVAVISGISDTTGLAEQVKVDNGELIVGGKIGLKNIAQANINPATEEKQDDIISALGGAGISTAYTFHDIIIDSVDANISYIGKEKSDGKWLIQQMDETSGIIMTYGNESNNGIYTTYTIAWAARESLVFTLLENLTNL